jgi:hypothetical protein
MKQNPSRSTRDALSDDEQRRRLIQQEPTALGTAWAISSCEELRQSGRSVEGGWPGTVKEARGRVQRELTRLLAARGLEPLRPEELVAATSAAYEQAKRAWQGASGARTNRSPRPELVSPPRNSERKNS